DLDPLTFAVVDNPAHGTLSGTAPDLIYTPDADFNGDDSFTFTVSDGALVSAPAAVSITVEPVNDAPVAAAQAVSTSEDTPLAITLTGSDVDLDPLTFAVVDNPAHGTLSGTAPDLIYTPDADFNGDDSFSFTVSDGALVSAPAAVSITVEPVNDAPLADSQTVTTEEDTPLAITLSGSDVDGDSLTFALVADPAHGTLSGTAPDLLYTPAAGYTGMDSFTFTVSDGTLVSAPAAVNITITPLNDAPVALNDQYTVNEDSVLTVLAAEGVLSNDTDLDGDDLAALLVSGPLHGTLSLDAEGGFIYTPAADFNGEDSFTYRAYDGLEYSEPATVIITVNEVPESLYLPVIAQP
ncbi:MAG TPA: Ig-like domain-containing protein, partial [Anaerolineales bacterium]|nr:Ig-like domain-containing protein [Anaerolineales bacterium]